MPRIKRVVNLPVRDAAQMLYLMKRLGTLDADLEAESRPGQVRIVLHGSQDEVHAIESKVRDLARAK